MIEFDSMINVRPSQGNRSRSVEDLPYSDVPYFPSTSLHARGPFAAPGDWSASRSIGGAGAGTRRTPGRIWARVGHVRFRPPVAALPPSGVGETARRRSPRSEAACAPASALFLPDHGPDVASM